MRKHITTTAVLLLIFALHVAKALPLVSFFSASEPTLGLRHCSGSIYATIRTWTDADLVWEPMTALDGNVSHVSLRSMNFPGSYLCSGGANNTVLAISPSYSTNAKCSFNMVSGLSDPRGVSFEQNGWYISLSDGLIGSCASSYPTIVPSGSRDVVLSQNPSSTTAATWYKADASAFRLFSGELALRHCLGQLYAYTPSTDSYPEDFVFVFSPALASGSSNKSGAVSLRSFNFPSLYIGLLSSETWKVGARTCEGSESDCTFTYVALSNGQFKLKHESSGRYLSLDTNVSGGCSWNSVDIVLDKANGTRTKAFNAWQWFQPVSVASIKTNLTEHQHTVSSLLYGLFFEEMNFGGDGGIYAEQIRNGDFQAQGRGDLGDNKTSSTPWVPITTDIRPWNVTVVSGTATITTTSSTQPYSANEFSLLISATSQEQQAVVVSLQNPGFWGIKVYSGLEFSGKFYARSSTAVTAVASLILNNDTAISSQASVQISGDDSWKQYSFSLSSLALASSSSSSSQKALFSVVFYVPANATMYLDGFSLFPSDAVSGLFRKDLFDMLKVLNPAFFRFPGGNFLEGYASWTRWNWKNTVGNRTSRPGHYNDAWGYWSSDGLGYYEYLLLCEALGTEPQLSIFTGYYLGRNYVPLNESGQIIQDAVDAIDFANAGTDNEYGALRASMGHPEPFNLHRVEVGNEETNMTEYKLHYDAITEAIWTKYPNIDVVGSGWWSSTPSVDLTGNPCTSGSVCDAWDEHYYMYPDVMALTYQNKYDSYPRSYPKVFVGEYSANLGDTPTLRAALAEASFMVGFERNADVVVQSAFCPLFGRIGGSVRDYNMINYNSISAFPIPSYYVQKMFREALPDYTFSSTYSGVANAAVGTTDSGIVYVKIVNYASSPALVEINLDGINESSIDEDAELTTYSVEWGTPGVGNSISSPDSIVPVVSAITVSEDFKLWVPSYSMAIVKISIPELASLKVSSSASAIQVSCAEEYSDFTSSSSSPASSSSINTEDSSSVEDTLDNSQSSILPTTTSASSSTVTMVNSAPTFTSPMLFLLMAFAVSHLLA